MEFAAFTLAMYNMALLPVIVMSLLFLVLSALNLVVEPKKQEKQSKPTHFPFVTVQVPTYNDPIAKRCVEHCLKFTYPKEKYEIQIVDDSTNKETQALLKELAQQHDHVSYHHRTNRKGFKAGALKEAMPSAKGEIISILDADWIPPNDFLTNIVQPFADNKIALVQARQGFYNKDVNLITRFASYILMIYHTIVMPINNKLNCVLFCGTAGAFRRDAFEKVGGWNLHSITEDADMSVRLLAAGYKSVYLTQEIPSEVPSTFEGFLKQQMRWCFGNTRVFIDYFKTIVFKPGLSVGQRIMISYITLGNCFALMVILMTTFGLMGWFVGDPTIMTWSDVWLLFQRIALTAGFFVIGLVTLYKQNIAHEFPMLVLSALAIGLIAATANAYAFLKAVTGRQLAWYCTPKDQNDRFVP